MTTSKTGTPFPRNFPKEMYWTVFRHLDVQTLCKIKSVCKIWYDLVSHNYIWSKHIQNKFSKYKNIVSVNHQDYYRVSIRHERPKRLHVYDGIIKTAQQNSFVIIEQPYPENNITKPSNYSLEHQGPITDFIEHKGRLITSSSDKTIKVWRKTKNDTFVPTQTLTSHKEPITELTVSDTHLFSGSCNGSLNIWKCNNPDDFSHLQSIQAHSGDINCLKIEEIEKNQTLFCGSSDNTMTIWRVKNNKFELFQKIDFHESSISKIHYTHKRNLLFIASKDQTVSIWKKYPTNFKLYQKLVNFESPITDLDYDKFRGILYAATKNGYIKIFKSVEGKFNFESKLKIQNHGLNEIAFARFLDNTYLYALTNNKCYIYRIYYKNKTKSYRLTSNIISFQKETVSVLRSSL